MNGDNRFRVFNRCKYDIGVRLINGQAINIKAGNFQLLSVDDILFIDGYCSNSKFFSSKSLVAVGPDGKELSLEELGGYTDTTTVKHLSDEEIVGFLKKPVAAMKAWLEGIDNYEELHAIYMVARNMDLPASKLKILKTKIPNKDWLGEEEE